ncbi:MAG: hydrogenase formation protein HypD [Synergistaceae bacterium]|jgi:hydrogenase expression/formation protein HypD|nr:hydrogenase formation protein HypD [Synergistaceae bacterium]
MTEPMPEFSRQGFEGMRRRLEELLSSAGRPLTFMEVCGTHTVSIFRSGLRSLLPDGLRLLSGPGCPVCVTDQSEIDMALALAEKGCLVLTYGDMMRVPGSSGSLLDLKGRGARVEVVTSAIQSVDIARSCPDSQVVFLGVGFETTAPATAVTLKQALLHDLPNFSVLSLHKTVPPILRALSSNPALNIDGFILPGNVTVVAGIEDYVFLTDELRKAAAVAGFQPEEILAALVDLSSQVASNRFCLRVFRARETPRGGNPVARKILWEVFEPCDTRWRGLGRVPASGCRIGRAYKRFDAAERFGLFGLLPAPARDNGCRCGDVLSGLLTPPECELYGTACTPLTPVGPCMVSGEGTCGAWRRYHP